MLLVTKQIPVAILGYHVVYTIEDMSMVYIPYVEKSNKKELNLEEQKYVKMFQSIDLRQNFYYSYTYDLTHTMQHNFTSINYIQKNSDPFKILGVKNNPSNKFIWNEFLLEPIIDKISYPWIIYLIHGYLSQSNILFKLFKKIFFSHFKNFVKNLKYLDLKIRKKCL